MADGNSSLSGSIVVFVLIFVLWLNWMRAGDWEIRRAAASAYLHTRVADIVLGLIDERLGLFLRLHVGADGGL